ncbi:MAG TPA: hypothetical protein VGB53_04040 [Rubricoccaceae bacterium]|jgi:hypothetical protein
MKSILLYIVLVGLPVAAVLAVLRLGDAVEAPPAVGGEWRVEGAATCAVPDRTFRIEQSGRYVHVLIAGRAKMTAHLAGATLAADGGARADVSPGCSHEPIRLRARASGRLASRLAGTIGVPGCAACPPARFVAVRVVPAPAAP